MEESKSMTMFDALFGEEIRTQKEVAELGYSIIEDHKFLFDKDALKVQPKIMWRMDFKGKRQYLTFADPQNAIPKFFISVTSSIASTGLLGIGQQLLEWYGNFPTYEQAVKALQRLADYGTFGHILYGEFIRSGELSLDSIPQLVNEYGLKSKLDYNNRFWIKSAKRDLMALQNFFIEHNVKPLAIELMLSGKDGYATMVDFICEMDIGTGVNGQIYKKDIKNGTVERVTAIIDWKSNISLMKHKCFYKPAEMQLEACLRLVNDNFPGLQIDKLYNVSFEGGLAGPKYVMKDQTDKAMEPCDVIKRDEHGNETVVIVPEFDMYWSLYKMQHPTYNNPTDLKDANGYVSTTEEGLYDYGLKSAKDVAIEKFRKSY